MDAAKLVISNGEKLLMSMYIWPGISFDYLETFKLTFMPKGSDVLRKLGKKGYRTIPILMMGDFNLKMAVYENFKVTMFFQAPRLVSICLCSQCI